ncbi:MAG: lipoate--protein ligase [Emergencia sp.]
MGSFRLIVEQDTDPHHNLAREEVLLDLCQQDTVYLWRNRPSVIVGRHQNTQAEVDLDFAKARGIKTVRRLTGGGAVYHDEGNVNLSFISCGGDSDDRAARGTELLTGFLSSLGAEPVVTGRNDICIRQDGKLCKIAGTAMTQRQDRGIFHACLLFDADMKMLGRVLTPSAEKLRSKGIASVRQRTVNLKEVCSRVSAMTSDAFFRSMAEYFLRLSGAETPEREETEHETRQIRRLMEERYLTWQWNFGRNPAASVENSCRFPIGSVEASVSVRGGCITDCSFSGDYLTAFDLGIIAGAVTGVRFEAEAVDAALGPFDIEKIFRTDDRSKVRDLILGRSIEDED